MPRVSAEAKAANLWRSGPNPPLPPPNLGQPAKKLWRALIASRPADHWTPAARVLLARLVQTVVAADRVSAQLASEPDLASERAAKLTRHLCALNTSASALLVKLRLTPQASHSRRETGFNNEPGVPFDDLIGGAVRREHALDGNSDVWGRQ